VVEEYEESVTPSEGYQHDTLKQTDLMELNFEEIFRGKGAEEKYQQLVDHTKVHPL